MAVTEINQQTKVKLAYQVENEEGEMRLTSRTLSNLVEAADNDAIYTGASAVAGLLDANAVQIVRVDEAELANV